MVINYKNTREDYEKGYESFYKRSVLVKSIQAGFEMMIIIGLLFYFLYEMSIFYNIDNKLYISAIVMLIIIYTIFYFGLKRIAKKNVSNTLDKLIELNPSMLGEKSLEISDGNLICKTEKGYSEYKAKAIDNVVEKDGRIILYIQKLNPVHVIPCSAFNSESEKNEFIKLIKKV
jgi:hypothetical protein